MQLMIFIGLQASGKSTFYARNLLATHVRINMDMLRTRHREKILFEACLEGKINCVIDNTNPTIQDRQRYIKPAKASGFSIIGFYFQSNVHKSMARNAEREGKAKVPDAAILGTYNKLTLPHYDEGFDELYYVRITDDNRFLVEDWQTDEI